jgi:uncharacterized protein involved in response to NO
MAVSDQHDNYRGPALFSYGFRPFFLFGSIYAGIAIPLWLLHIRAGVDLGTVFTPIDWHVHEMLYGFVPAIVTGFLLTAIPNWTKRLPIKGFPLFALFLLWLAGRTAIFFSALAGWAATAAVDVAFLAVVAAAASREIIAGRNWRNLKVVGIVGLLAIGNLTFHLEVHFSGSADYGIRIGLSAVIFLISLVGGRIVPSFTHNWLARQKAGRLPASFGSLDAITIALSFCALVAWVIFPFSLATGIALVGAGLAQLLRFARWAGERTISEPIVLVLHLAYAFIPVGFVLIGWSIFGQIPKSAGIHAWTAGAIGTMILAVTTRASLGHTGRALIASKPVQAIYLTVIVSAVSRIFGSFQPEWNEVSLLISALAWSSAFLGFGVVYAPVLCVSQPAKGP